VFRDQQIPKDKLSLNAEDGVVYLRGEVPDQDTMDELVARARRVDGIKGVENLTHLPSEAAPTKSS
jgi:osmotically-inducible protein OsmY